MDSTKFGIVEVSFVNLANLVMSHGFPYLD
jgi:hypothetical protein